LVVKAGAKEYLVPFAAEFLGRVDLERKRIEMALPQGLLELDAPLSEEEKRAQQDADRD
jgi:16S rRNA processing protein RimM